MLRDFFAPFGIWLPRNSYQQSQVGRKVMLEGLDDETKRKTIIEQAIPFETLLYKEGHIVLYLGTYHDEIVVMHDVWGVKTMQDEEEGRVIIGKNVISTLHLGKELKYYDLSNDMLKKLVSMNIVTEAPQQ